MATIRVKVVPSSSRDVIAGWLGDALKIKVMAPPEKGRANAAVIDLLASTLEIDSRSIVISRGHSSPIKTVTFDELTDAQLNAAIQSIVTC